MRAIWRNEEGKIYTGLLIYGYPVPTREFGTLAEFVEYVAVHRAELIRYLEFIERVFAEANKAGLSPRVAEYINSLVSIDTLKQPNLLG